MKQAIRRALTLVLALCLTALPVLSSADTYLPDGEVTHVDFTLNAALYPEGFPATDAHLADWAALLAKLDIKGSMDALAMLNPESRVYLNGALRLNGKEQIPFVYDGYHSYRYLLSPALGNDVFFFQMHNFLEFMLKPYYYMELPTQYLGLLMYPEASVYLGNSFFTPVRDTLAAAKEDAAAQEAADRDALLSALADAQAQNAAKTDDANARIAELKAALAELAAATPAPTPTPEQVVPVTAAPETPATSVTAAADGAATVAVTTAPETTAEVAAVTAAPQPTVDGAALQAELDTLTAQLAALNDEKAALDLTAQNAETLSLAELKTALTGYVPDGDAQAEGSEAEDSEAEGGETGDAAEAAATLTVPEGATVYTVPYERLYELCETLDSVTNDDPDLERVYFYFTSLLVESLSSDMVVDTLGRLEDTLDALDPEQSGMTVVETDTGMTCAFGDTTVFTLSTEGGGTDFALTLPTSDDYEIDLAWRYLPGETGAALSARAALVMQGEDSIALSLEGEGLPREGDVSGNGKLTVQVSGTSLEAQPKPVTLAFDWVRNAKEKPYTLGLTLGLLHPDTGKLALSLAFNGTFTAEDRSVFVEGRYPQNDFFNLNETSLDEYKARVTKPLALKLLPLLLETPAGVIDDLYRFADSNDILVSLME